MRRRDIGAVVGFVIVTAVVAGLSRLDLRGLASPRAEWIGASPPGAVEVVLRWFVVAVGALVLLAVVVLLAHQYVRWEAYRPAVHLAVVLLVFVGALAWLLGPVGVGGSAGGLTADERQLIRVSGFGLLFFLVLYVVRLVDDANGDAG